MLNRSQPGQGYPCAIIATDDHYLMLKTNQNRTPNVTHLQRQFLLTTGERISNETVKNKFIKMISIHVANAYISLTSRYHAVQRSWTADH